MDNLKMLLDEHMLSCNKCNSNRRKLDYEELPIKMQNVFKELRNCVDYYLYCSCCEEYSMIMNDF